MAKDRRPAATADGAAASDAPAPEQDWRKRWGNEELWTRLTCGGGRVARPEVLRRACSRSSTPFGVPQGVPPAETGRLRVVDGACPNLLYEAGLYRYDDATNGRGSETPLSESNHALDALRYLITRLDQRRMAKDRRPTATADGAAPPEAPAPKQDWRKRWGNEELWTRLTCGGGRVARPEVLRRACSRSSTPFGVPQGVPPAETGRLRVVDGACPNLLYEAGLYRYDDATNGRGSEPPPGREQPRPGRPALPDHPPGPAADGEGPATGGDGGWRSGVRCAGAQAGLAQAVGQ